MVGGVQRDSDCERRLSSRRGPSDLYMHAASLWLAQGSASADLRAATVIAPRSQRLGGRFGLQLSMHSTLPKWKDLSGVLHVFAFIRVSIVSKFMFRHVIRPLHKL